MGMTFAEKILAKKAGLKHTVPNQIVIVKPDYLLMHDNSSAIVGKIKNELQEFGVANPDMPIIVLDHVIPASDEKIATNHQKTRDFIKKYNLKNFYDIGGGICHQVVFEKGFAKPGTVIVGSDSHTCSYGAVGSFATGIDRTEAAALLLRGETWFKVPESIKITFENELKPPVSAKDVVLSIIGDIGADGADYCSVEFHGNIGALTIDDRFTIANMGVEMGAKVAVFPVDRITRKHLSQIGLKKDDFEVFWADRSAKYKKELTYDLSKIEPVVSAPHTVDKVKAVRELEGVEFNQFLLGTCTNGRLSDLKVAADILEGKKIAPGVRFLILPASKEIFEAALKKGIIERLSKAGGIVLPTGCGPCLGAHMGILAPGERCLSTANRNFKGRMGCKEAEIYLASPATVAVSALTGKLTDPRKPI